MIEIRASIRRDAFALEADIATEARVLCLFGRSGAGKTSIAHAVAGLVRPRAGRIVIDGEVLFDHGARLDVPAWRRRVGYVFQDARLFPHLSVRDNLLYGARRAGPADPRQRELDLRDIAMRLGLHDLLDRAPAGLSGGEARRVAIGRALLARPRLLVLDEPLSGLDGARRADLLGWLERLGDAGPPVLYISHAVDEAARLADAVALVAGGRACDPGPPGEVFARPEAEAAAGLTAPISILEGRIAGHDPAAGLSRIDLGGAMFQAPRLAVASGGRVRVVVDARDVALALSDPADASFQNRLPLRVAELEARPGGTLVRLAGEGFGLCALVTPQAAARLELAPGRPVIALVKATAAARYA